MPNKKFTHLSNKITEDIDAVTNKDGSRFYQAPNGEKYPSVTTVTGWEKKAFFAEWRRKNPKESKRVLSVGTSMHQVVEDFLDNKETYLDGASQYAINLFQYMKPVLIEKIDNIKAQEVALWSSLLGLAGRVDCVAEYDGKLSIIDFKSSRREKKEEYIGNYFAQATAYAIMWKELTGEQIDQIVILISCEDGSVQQFIDKPVNHVKTLKEMIDKYYQSQALSEYLG